MDSEGYLIIWENNKLSFINRLKRYFDLNERAKKAKLSFISNYMSGYEDAMPKCKYLIHALGKDMWADAIKIDEKTGTILANVGTSTGKTVAFQVSSQESIIFDFDAEVIEGDEGLCKVDNEDEHRMFG